MPKIKTKRGAAKRFKVRPSGIIKFNRSNRRHLLTTKTTKVKRQSRRSGNLHKADNASIKQMLPNS